MRSATTTWRPRNESSEDISNEKTASELIGKRWNCNVSKLSEILYHIDWVLHRDNKVIGFGEYKRRAQIYKTVILSLAKIEIGQRWARMSNTKFFLFIEWDTALGYCDLTNFNTRTALIEMGGNSRGQNGDIEPVIHIPTPLFKQIPR